MPISKGVDKKAVVHFYTMEHYSAVIKKEILLFVMELMKLEGTMLSKISQSEKDKYHMISHICGI